MRSLSAKYRSDESVKFVTLLMYQYFLKCSAFCLKHLLLSRKLFIKILKFVALS